MTDFEKSETHVLGRIVRRGFGFSHTNLVSKIPYFLYCYSVGVVGKKNSHHIKNETR